MPCTFLRSPYIKHDLRHIEICLFPGISFHENCTVQCTPSHASTASAAAMAISSTRTGGRRTPRGIFFSNASSHIPWVGCLKPLANLDQYGSTWINIHTILYYVLHALTCALFGWHPIRQPLTQLSDEQTKFFQSFRSPWHAMANLSEHLRRDLAGNSPGLHNASKD